MNNAYISSPASMGMRRSLVKQLLRSDRQRRRFSTRSTGNTAQQQRPPRNEASNFSAARKLLNTKQIHSVAIEECGGSSSKTLFHEIKPQNASADLPSMEQLKTLFFASAAPMVGFGFMDNFIMIQAGGLIDSTLGVKFGLATLTAAAMGQIFSDVSGVMFGGVVERGLSRIGFNPPSLSLVQRKLSICRNVTMAGAVFGVICGCLLGASSLMFMDLDSADRQRRVHEMFDAWNQMVENCHAIGSRDSAIYFLYGNVGVEVPQGGIVQECAESGVIIRCERTNFESIPTMCVPVRTPDGQVIAVVEFKDKKTNNSGFTKDDEHFAEMLASHMSIIFMAKLGYRLS